MKKLIQCKVTNKMIDKNIGKAEVFMEPGERIMGTCKECGKPHYYKDDYVVKPEIWEEAGMGTAAGMGSYDFSGHLHRECLETRIGRKLIEDDLFAWVTAFDASGVTMTMTPEGAKYIALHTSI